MALFASIKNAWVEALRSGEYEQTDSELKNDFGYCCLGVLREIVNPNDERSAQGENGMLSNEQLQEYGLDGRTQKKLANMNDDGVSFDEIADYIESRLRSVDGGTMSQVKKAKVPARDSLGRFIKRK